MYYCSGFQGKLLTIYNNIPNTVKVTFSYSTTIEGIVYKHVEILPRATEELYDIQYSGGRIDIQIKDPHNLNFAWGTSVNLGSSLNISDIMNPRWYYELG